MATSVLEKIRKGLDSRLKATTEIPSVGGVKQIAWENLRFIPTEGTPWVRPTLSQLEAPMDSLGINNFLKRSGLYLINVFSPKFQPTNVIENIAGGIEQRFRGGTKITQDDITITILKGHVHNQILIGEEAWINLPLVVEWYCYENLT